MTTTPDRVEVVWIDSASDGAWQNRERAVREAVDDGLIQHYTCGYLIADERDYVLVAGSWREGTYSGEEMVADTMLIPRVAILDGPKRLSVRR